MSLIGVIGEPLSARSLAPLAQHMNARQAARSIELACVASRSEKSHVLAIAAIARLPPGEREAAAHGALARASFADSASRLLWLSRLARYLSSDRIEHFLEAAGLTEEATLAFDEATALAAIALHGASAETSLSAIARLRSIDSRRWGPSIALVAAALGEPRVAHARAELVRELTRALSVGVDIEWSLLGHHSLNAKWGSGAAERTSTLRAISERVPISVQHSLARLSEVFDDRIDVNGHPSRVEVYGYLSKLRTRERVAVIDDVLERAMDTSLRAPATQYRSASAFVRSPAPIEPDRVYRRLPKLRGWSHGTTEQVLRRGSRASGAPGARERG